MLSDLDRMPAIFVHDRNVLGLREELELGNFVRALSHVLAFQRQTLLRRGRIQTDLDRRLADVRTRRHENRPCVLDRLSRLPVRRRLRRIVIVGPDQFVVGIDDVHHHALVLIEVRILGDDERVGEVEWAAERDASARQRHAGGRDRRRFGLFRSASGEPAGHDDERDHSDEVRTASSR